MLAARLERRDDGVARRCVAQRDRDVAQPSLVADAPDRRALEAPQEFFFGPREELDERCAIERVTHREVGIVDGAGVFVPGADELAIVAAVNAVSHERAQLFRDRAVMLDGEIRDAAARIELVGRDDRPRGTYVDAAVARAAVLGGGCILLQIEVREELAEEEEGPRVA